MKVNILKSSRQTLPRYNSKTNQDEHTVMVVTEVAFINGKGKKVYSQTYAQLPEEVNPKYFQAQADAMQDDLDHTAIQSVVDEQAKLADDKVEQLTKLINKKANAK
jgi:hypothetical protein